MFIFGVCLEFARRNSVEALNFQITLLIGYIISFVLTFVIIVIFLFVALAIAAIVFMILASIVTYNHKDYRYPINIRMVK